MFGLNNAQLIGRLGADATISHLTNGGRVANVSIGRVGGWRGDCRCPSSKQMGLLSVFHKGGSGSSLFDVKPLGVDGSSGGFGWSVF